MVTYNIYTKIAAHIALSKIVEYYMLLFERNACNKNPLHPFSPIFSTLANDVKKKYRVLIHDIKPMSHVKYNDKIVIFYCVTYWRL